MLVACRLAGLSTLGAHYAGVKARAQCEAAWPARPPRSDGSENQKIGTQWQAWRRQHRRIYIVGQFFRRVRETRS